MLCLESLSLSFCLPASTPFPSFVVQYLTQVGFNRMSVNIDDALPVFEKAVGIAGTPSTHMNFGFCLMAKVFGVEAAQASTLPPAPAWAPELDRAVEQFTAGIGRDAGCVVAAEARVCVAVLGVGVVESVCGGMSVCGGGEDVGVGAGKLSVPTAQCARGPGVHVCSLLV